MSLIKRDIFDKMVSDLCRERANWCCEYCGRYFAEGERGGLDCSHYYGRKNKSTRYDPDNVFALCKYHHRYMAENPGEHYEFVRSIIGDGAMQLLAERFRSKLVLKKHDKEDLKKHLKKQLDIMAQKRKSGDTSRIDFERWM